MYTLLTGMGLYVLLLSSSATLSRYSPAPALQVRLYSSVIERENVPKQSSNPFPLSGEGKGEGDKLEDLRKELLSRKYSYKTVKGYLYYNRNFINFVNKKPSEINDSDIKDYLLYLAEEKEAATSTLNQAINAVKFIPYWGSFTAYYLL